MKSLLVLALLSVALVGGAGSVYAELSTDKQEYRYDEMLIVAECISIDF